MPPQVQVKVSESGFGTFGGIPVRRLSVSVAGQLQHLLIHDDQSGMTPYLLEQTGLLSAQSHAAGSPLQLSAEWGEPLGEVCALHTDEPTGKLTAYTVRLRQRDGGSEVKVGASDTYWWNSGLYCRKRASYQLRDIQRGKRARLRPAAA